MYGYDREQINRSILLAMSLSLKLARVIPSVIIAIIMTLYSWYNDSDLLLFLHHALAHSGCIAFQRYF